MNIKKITRILTYFVIGFIGDILLTYGGLNNSPLASFIGGGMIGILIGLNIVKDGQIEALQNR